jgi:hypothetical protein
VLKIELSLKVFLKKWRQFKRVKYNFSYNILIKA